MIENVEIQKSVTVYRQWTSGTVLSLMKQTKQVWCDGVNHNIDMRTPLLVLMSA